VLAGKFTL